MRTVFAAIVLALVCVAALPQSKVWVADNGDGTYRNPFIHADRFSFSLDGKTFRGIGSSFRAREGRWIGAKIGFVFTRPEKFNDAGSVDIDWFRFEEAQ